MFNKVPDFCKNIIITGGAGFIGSFLIRKLLRSSDSIIYNIDKLGYASDLSSIKDIDFTSKRHKFIKLDLNNKSAIEKVIDEFNPNLIIHFAAESHVDRSINSPIKLIESNILGTFNMVETATRYWEKLDPKNKIALEYQGELFVELDRLDEANANLSKLVELCPKSCEELEMLRDYIDGNQTKAW